jgi:HSP20 family protein
VRRLDVHHDKLEDTNTVMVSFDLPSLQKEDMKIDVHNDVVLTVSGETRSALERSEEGYAVRERPYGKFGRSVSLPQRVKVGSDFAFLRQKGLLNIFITE